MIVPAECASQLAVLDGTTVHLARHLFEVTGLLNDNMEIASIRVDREET